MGRHRSRPRELRQRGHRRPGPAQVRRLSHLSPRRGRRRSPHGDQRRDPLRRVDPVDARNTLRCTRRSGGTLRASRTFRQCSARTIRSSASAAALATSSSTASSAISPRRSSMPSRCSGGHRATSRRCSPSRSCCERFTLERVNAAAAIFDPKRLDDLNGIHIRRMTTDELVEALEYHLPGTSKETRRLADPDAPRADGDPCRRDAPLRTAARRGHARSQTSSSRRRRSIRRPRSR